jgi:nucleobase:cation symporter-1, NCS1 family
MSQRVPNPLTRSIFSGRRPTEAGDLSVETHGIAPIPEDQRYGAPGRLFTMWFAPQINMIGVFTGALAIVLGLGFWLGLLAMVIGSVFGVLIVAYLSTRRAPESSPSLSAALSWVTSLFWALGSQQATSSPTTPRRASARLWAGGCSVGWPWS